jgi:hypothetical protein
MKNLLYIFLGLLLLTSCASTKTSKAPSPTGNWDYTITGTPEGDFVGVMTISEVDKIYSAKMATSAGEVPLDKYLYDKETKKMSGEFYYSGTLVLFDAVFAVDQIDGGMSAGGMSFPFKATRKK